MSRLTKPHAGLLALVLLTACAEERAPVAPSAEPRDEARGEAAGPDLDALRALGYAGEASEELDPAATGVVLHDRERAEPGYNLYTVRPLCLVVLMDNEGEVLRRWERPGHRAWSNAQLLENGDLLVIGQELSRPYIGAVDEHRYLLRLDWDGEVVWRADLNAHHDVEVTPSADLAVLSFRRVNGSELAPAGVELREDLIVRLSQEGELLDQRSILAALRSGTAPFVLGEVAPAGKRVRYVDLVHANSVEFMRRPELVGRHPLHELGNVLVSMRHQDAVCVFEWESGDLVWSWGRGELIGPHDATVLDSGNLLIFDNGLGRGWSRVIELDPVRERIVWEYRADPPEAFYTASRGSAQRLPGGNTLIAESDTGRAFEVTPAGELVWEWRNPDLSERWRITTVVRMKRLPEAYVEGILTSRR